MSSGPVGTTDSHPTSSAPQPLEEIRVIDLSRILAGPYCTMMLGDLGAEVIKIEQPGVGDGTRQWGPPWAGLSAGSPQETPQAGPPHEQEAQGESAYYLCVNRNKRSLTLNLKTEEGREVVRRLVRSADVLIENFRVGTMERMGLGYEELRKINPGLIYCSITGFGPDGPYNDRPGYDFIIQAMGGIMSITGPAEGPPYKVGLAIVDVTAGLYAAVAILGALRHREGTGQGQQVDVALLDSQVAWLINVASNYLVSGERPKRYGNAHPNIVPYETFRATDRHFALGIGNDRQFRQLCEVIGRPAWAEDPRFATNPKRVENRELLVPMLQEVFETREAQAWLEALVEQGIPCAPINAIDEVFANPQVRAREMVLEVPHPTAGTVELVGFPFKLSETPAAVRRHPPLLGEHTEEILTEVLDYTPQEVETLRAKGVI